jgi:hypothetical protein
VAEQLGPLPNVTKRPHLGRIVSLNGRLHWHYGV